MMKAMNAVLAIGLILAMCAAAQAATLGDNLVGYYKFDGNLTDATGNNPNATLTGAGNVSATDKLPGFGTGAADLGSAGGGSNTDHAEIAQTNSLNFGSGAFTITGWVRFNGHGTGRQPYGNSTSGTGWRASVGSNGNWGLVYDTDTQASQTSSQHLPHFQNDWNSSATNRWYFTASVVDPSAGTVTGYGGRYYVLADGITPDSGLGLKIHSGTAITGGGSIDNPGPFLIGTTFDGTWDEVAMWNRALTLTEIGQLYNDGHARDLSEFTVPEPATMSLLALGGLGALIRRKKR